MLGLLIPKVAPRPSARPIADDLAAADLFALARAGHEQLVGRKNDGYSIKVMASWRLISGESFNTILPIAKNLYIRRTSV